MLLKNIMWVGDEIRIELYDVDGDRQTVILNVADALDIKGWLKQEYPKLLEVLRRQIKQAEQEEQAS